ncbi:cyclic AMP-dependent transcription factor ATF-5-like [Neltuma alba]|uniref:cyclic AMP-dependent transcription factor ATF-5-like n=1 Tax=Neltuma alba TaxID=207710 RepID=UPI0010A2DAB1|nr:cyclic AMP-dependent transcription factor ATF-5-like [Prosopis alba]
MFQAELKEFERRVYTTAKDYGEVSDRKFEGITKILDLYHQAMVVLEKEVSQSFEDLLSHPPSPPHPEPTPPTSPIPTSPVSTSLSVPSTSPTLPATLALITVPQPIPSLHFPPFSPLSQLPLLPIPLPMPTVSIPSPSADADKKGEKDSSYFSFLFLLLFMTVMYFVLF